MPTTLEQQRAAHAWSCASGCVPEYANLAKSTPALIMNSGLIQVVAFLNEKARDEKRAHGPLANHLQAWLAQRFPHQLPRADFDTVMSGLMQAEPQTFQAMTAEALAWLRWLRKIAPARQQDHSHAPEAS